jgi:hypothetical protein
LGAILSGELIKRSLAQGRPVRSIGRTPRLREVLRPSSEWFAQRTLLWGPMTVVGQADAGAQAGLGLPGGGAAESDGWLGLLPPVAL